MFGAIRTQVAALDPEIPMFDVKTLEEHIGVSLFLQRMAATLLSIFGALALSLAALGFYSVIAMQSVNALGNCESAFRWVQSKATS